MEQERTHHDVGLLSRLMFVGTLHAAMLGFVHRPDTAFYSKPAVHWTSYRMLWALTLRAMVLTEVKQTILVARNAFASV